MPNWISYSRDPDGMIGFVDDMGGKLRMVESPSVLAEMQAIDARNAAPPVLPQQAPPPMPQPMTPEAVPDGIASAKSPTMTMRLSNEIADEVPANAQGASGGQQPPLEPAGAGGASQGPAQGAPAQPATPIQAAPSGPIVRNANGGGLADQIKDTRLKFLLAEADKAGRGSPGVRVAGGTFPTGSTVQRQLGPDPGATAQREELEGYLGRVQSDLAYVDARKNQELQELAAAEAARAAERQKKLEELQARQQEKLGGVLEKIDAKRQEIADAKIDPNGLVNSMSTGRQALTGIMLLLGGFGKALSGSEGPSQAMQVLDDAIKTDVEMQRYAIEKKRGDLNTLGEIYRLTKEQFGDERMAQDAAYLAGLDIYKSKIQKTIAEADAAMGVETQIDGEGKVIAGAPYSMRALEVLARLDVEQARLRESLSQAANGQVAQQYVTTQDRVVGATAPNAEKRDKLLKEAGEIAEGSSDQQQVNYGGQQYATGKYVSASEGAEVRKKLNLVNALHQQVAKAKAMRNSLVGVDPMRNKEYVDTVNTIAGMRSVLIEQGVLQGNEREEFQGLSQSIMSGGDVLTNIGNMADRIASGYMDQLNAKPVRNSTANVAMPKGLVDAANGKPQRAGPAAASAGPASAGPATTSGGAPGNGGSQSGTVRRAPQAQKPKGPIARANGVRATPLDRAGASLVTATTAKDTKARGKAIDVARSALADSLKANQLGQREYAVAIQMADAGDIDGLLQFLGRMRGAVSLAPASSVDDFNRQVSNQILTNEMRRAVLPNRP